MKRLLSFRIPVLLVVISFLMESPSMFACTNLGGLWDVDGFGQDWITFQVTQTGTSLSGSITDTTCGDLTIDSTNSNAFANGVVIVKTTQGCVVGTSIPSDEYFY